MVVSCTRVARVRRCLLALAVGALVACTTPEPSAPEDPPPSEPPTQPDGAAPTTTADPEPTPTPRDCQGDGPLEPLTDATGHDPAVVALAISGLTHRCAESVVVVPADDAWAATVAAPLAAAAAAPLLLLPDDPAAVRTAIDDLAPATLVGVGVPSDVLEALTDPGDVEVLAIGSDDATDADPDTGADPGTGGDAADAEAAGATDVDPDVDPGASAVALALAVLEHLDGGHVLAFDVTEAGSRAAALSRADEGLPLLPLPADAATLQAAVTRLPASVRLETIGRDDAGAQALADRLVDLGVDAEAATRPRFATDPADVAWLADPADVAAYAVAAAAAGARGEVLLPVHGPAPWHGTTRAARLRDVAPDRLVLVGAADPGAAAWQLPTVLGTTPLPGGGFTLFEDERMVALYGTPGSTALGALGEQDLDAAVARAREVAEPYGADGHAVLPAFEIITTVASASAEPTGDYSRRIPSDRLLPWIERAAEEGIYVILDLQPGRTDFLDQAQEYADLLRHPHVGLALDPEWRLADDEVHLRQIGSVDAAEVQRVADWLSELVRDERLPQKLLLLHQFRFSMLPDRDTIEVGPELAAVVHMDGQGSLSAKYQTYAAITAGAEDRWLWGWKNFYDEDAPTATPDQVLELAPLPVFVSYQ